MLEYSGITSGQHARAMTTVKPTAVAVSARSSQSRAMQQGPQEPQEPQPKIHFMIRIGSRLPSLVDGRVRTKVRTKVRLRARPRIRAVGLGSGAD